MKRIILVILSFSILLGCVSCERMESDSKESFSDHEFEPESSGTTIEPVPLEEGFDPISTSKDKYSWKSYIEIGLVNYEEVPSDEPGMKEVVFQVFLQNNSENVWLEKFQYTPKIITSDGFEYDHFKSSVWCSLEKVTFGDDLNLICRQPNLSRSSEQSTLAPGFQTLLMQERWLVPENWNNPSLELAIFSKGEDATYSIPLSDKELAPINRTPFSKNLSWNDYYEKYSPQKNLNVLKRGESRDFPFGKLTFLGFKEVSSSSDIPQMPSYITDVIVLEITNSSSGYPLSLVEFKNQNLMGGSIVRSRSTHFSIHSPSGPYADVGPDQKTRIYLTIEQLGSRMNIDENSIREISDTSPKCVTAKILKYEVHDYKGPVFSETPINLIACEE